MKIIGLMCVKDEADLLPEVYPHISKLVDELYAYDDGSIDSTWNYIKDSTYAIRKVDDKNRLHIPRPNYHHLLEKVKQDFDYIGEDIWVAITMGDRFFLNKTPKELVDEVASFYTAVEAIQLDFLRHRADPWTEENDTYPHYTDSLRNICRWVRVDEKCIIMFKVTDECSYLESSYPWPRTLGFRLYGDPELSLNIPFLEHQGRRSPKAAMWRHSIGGRPLSKKYPHYDISSFTSTLNSMNCHYFPYRVCPWLGLKSLEDIVSWSNNPLLKDWSNIRITTPDIEHFFANSYYALPKRLDI